MSDLKKKIEGQEPEKVLETLCREIPGEIVFSTSFSLEDQVITAMIAEMELPIRIFTLDTGRLFRETYEVFHATRRLIFTPIEVYFPDGKDLESFVQKNGPDAFYDSVSLRIQCCGMRKVRPLKRALQDAKCWVTGLNRRHSIERKDLEMLEWDKSNELVKVHPLLEWDEQRIRDYLTERSFPHNELYDKGYPSVGCAPCTRPIEAGEDPRAGRWWWEKDANKECGLHVVDGKLVRSKET